MDDLRERGGWSYLGYIYRPGFMRGDYVDYGASKECFVSLMLLLLLTAGGGGLRVSFSAR